MSLQARLPLKTQLERCGGDGIFDCNGVGSSLVKFAIDNK